MKIKNFIRVLLSVVLVFGFSSAWAKTIKWSMQGDSLTLDPHAQNEGPTTQVSRSEEHTSELQSRLHLVCRRLLEKKKCGNR